MRVLTLSGWAQDPCALDAIVPEGMAHAALDYMPQDERAFFALLKKEKRDCDILLGWSLGAQIAARAVAEKIIMPKLLVLLAAPFHFEADAEYRKAARRFASSPKEMLRDFSALLMAGDDGVARISAFPQALDYASTLKEWLKVLERFDCSVLDFTRFPRTFLIHGKKDAVIPRQQSWLYKEAISNVGLIELDRCGHAPHVHNPQGCRKLIQMEAERAAKL